MSANLESNPSFVWRSIIESQELAHQGSRRRVGNSSQIDIVTYPWLPCNSDPRVSTRNLAFMDQKVSSLMVTGNLSWDHDLVRDLFNNRDAELIFSIPLNSSRQQDILYWSLEKTGQFPVKSAYRHLQKSKEGGINFNGSSLWKKIWKLRVPLKVKDLI